MKIVTCFLTPSSPWAYLGHARFVDIARRHGASIALRPVDLSRVFAPSGGLPLARRAPQRQAYRLVELARWRDHLGVPLNLHPKHFPVASDEASQLIIATDLAAGTAAALDLTLAMMRVVWADERDLADAATLASLLAAQGLDAGAIAARADDARAAYDANTEEAIRLQVFGAPWYVVDGVGFWGQDRLDFVDRALAR